MEKLTSAVVFFTQKLAEFYKTDFHSVRFESPTLAIGAAALLAAALLIKIILSAGRKPYLAYSGHAIPQECRPSVWLRILRLAPKGILTAGVALLLLALAKPFLPQTKEVITVESRERIDLIDISASMGFPYQQTDKCAGEVARKAHLQFLSLRRGKNDRASLWVFANWPYRVDDFILDDDTYFFEVYDAPYTMTFPNSMYLNGGVNEYERIIAPPDRIRLIDNEGHTDLAEALRAVIKYFDAEGRPEIKRKSVLIMTDAASSTWPEQELQELQKRRIVPYIIFVKPDFEDPVQIPNSERLVEQIGSFGGKCFVAANEKEIMEAARAVDRLESAKIEIEKCPGRQPIFQRFLTAGLALLVLGIISGLLVELLWGEYP